MNREIILQFQKHFMMQPCEGVFSLFIQLFFLECNNMHFIDLRMFKGSSQGRCHIIPNSRSLVCSSGRIMSCLAFKWRFKIDNWSILKGMLATFLPFVNLEI